MENKAVIIDLKNISISFDDQPILKDVSLEIHDGEFVTLLGPSGCGKTTTLRIIAGFLSPDSGDVIFEGKKINGVPAHKRQVNTIFQRYALFPNLNVADNIAFGLKLQKKSKSEIKKIVEEMLSLVNLKGFEKRNVSSLSGGQQQRVAIARALAVKPRVLLLDEPLGALDLKLRKDMQSELKAIQQRLGITFIYVTHDQEEAMSISDMIVVMKKGVVQQVGEPQKVYDDPVNLFVAKFLGTPPINVFTGRVEGEKLMIGDEAVLDVKGAPDGEVYAAVRPEGFILDENGPLTCKLSGVEVMGRDVSIVSRHKASVNPIIRAIIGSDNKVDTASATVRFSLKPHKTFIFGKDSEERIRFGE